jgi:hypothetical protein
MNWFSYLFISFVFVIFLRFLFKIVFVGKLYFDFCKIGWLLQLDLLHIFWIFVFSCWKKWEELTWSYAACNAEQNVRGRFVGMFWPWRWWSSRMCHFQENVQYINHLPTAGHWKSPVPLMVPVYVSLHGKCQMSHVEIIQIVDYPRTFVALFNFLWNLFEVSELTFHHSMCYIYFRTKLHLFSSLAFLRFYCSV